MTDPVDSLHGLYFEDMREGMTEAFGKTVSEADIASYAAASGDTNPIHLHEDFAATTRFGTRIAHGMLSGGFISTVIGTKLPGPGCAYVNQALRFKAPVRIGDTVTAVCKVTKLIPEKNFVELETRCLVGDRVVIDGEATVWVPSRTPTMKA